MTVTPRLLVLAMLVAGGSPVVAQTPTAEHVVAVLVTAASDRSVYLDHGRDVGLQVGDLVRLFSPTGGDVEASVRSVSYSSARAELPPFVPLPPVGTRGEASISSPVSEATRSTAGQVREVPEHAPWTRNLTPRAAEQPLLVPAFGQRPDQRNVTIDGRWFTQGQWNRDRGDGRSSDYLLLRSGLRADVHNALGTGERVRLAGEAGLRSVWLPDAPDESDRTGRIDVASVAFGTEAYAPVGAEFGRFLSSHLPEIGLIDGAEVVFRYQDGLRFGGGLGAYPRPFPARNTGDDLGVHAFVDYLADPERSFAVTLGLQKTWHRGAPDRDLVLLRSEWRPTRQLSVLTSGKVDFYSGRDTIKGRGAELTELLAQARWTGRSTGVGITASRFTWPELQRFEYQVLSNELVRDGKVDRVSLRGSWRPWSWLSLRARGDRWQDQQRDGTSVAADVDVRGAIGEGSSLSLSLFRNDGSYTSGPGVRIALQDRLGAGSWRVGYRWHRYQLDTLLTGGERYTRQSAELRLSWPLGDQSDLDLTCQRWFGDGEDAVAVGFYLQWRF